MLGKTSGGLYWMFRFLERGDNTARLIEAGFRIALTRSNDSAQEWKSIVTAAGVSEVFEEQYDDYTAVNVVDFLLRDASNQSSIISVTEKARTNARMVRTALTTEVWEAVNENWMVLKDILQRPVRETELPAVLGKIRRNSDLVRGAVHGTMLRNDIYDFSQIGTAVERADYTARIINVKSHTLSETPSPEEFSLDNVHWETILRSVSAHRSFRWLNEADMSASSIANFLILDSRFPRSLSFCSRAIEERLNFLAKDYGFRMPCHDLIDAQRDKLREKTINSIFDEGLHQFVNEFIRDNDAIGLQIEQDYRFNK